MTASRIYSVLILAAAYAVACGSSDAHRATATGDAGLDGTASGAGGKGGAGGRTPTADSGTGGSTNRDAGRSPSDAGVTRRDAGAGGRAPNGNDASSDASASGGSDAGIVLGEFCVFADPNMESFVRSEVSNLNVDGGAPTGPIPVALASRVTSIDLFCDCSETLDVSGIECLTGLQSINLSGAYANLDHLALLPNLTDVTIQYGDGTLPPELAQLPHLHALDLRNDNMSDLSALTGLTTLTDLELTDNQVTDLTPLAGLVNLQVLDVTANQLVDLTPLAALHQLQSLLLGGNQVTDLTPLAGLTALTNLDASFNAFTDLGPLQGLVNLQTLSINSNLSITDLSPLVANTGLGAGDQIYATLKLADCASFKADVATLTNRGVTLTDLPVCP